MIERGTNNVRFARVESRNSETLLAVLKKYVHKNATVITDCWKGYEGLHTHFRRHQTVNHSENFINPETGAHTQSIENQWQLIKRRMRVQHTNISKDDRLTLCLSEYVYRYHYRHLNSSSLTVQFMSDICRTISECKNRT